MEGKRERRGPRDEISTAPAASPPDRGPAGALRAYWPGGFLDFALAPGATLTLGRDERCDLHIPHVSVSRRHARLKVAAGLSVEDMGSHNGTFVAGARLQARLPAPVGAGQVVTLGDAIVVWHAPLSFAGALPRRGETPGDSEVIIRDPVMEHLYEHARSAGTQSMNVLICGELGTGKVAVAGVVHRGSSRSPLVAVNCALRPDAQLEVALFGSEPAGAVAEPGVLEMAQGGTVLLTHVGDLSEDMQLKLLRVLETHECTRVGGERPVKIDVRFVTTTGLDFEARVRQKRFRSDLFYRLAGVTLRVPALRERPLEIVPLAVHFLRSACAARGQSAPSLSREAEAQLLGCRWPGNLRDLRTAMQAVAAVDCGDRVEVAHLPAFVRAAAAPAPAADGLRAEIAATQRRRVEGALLEANGNQTVAARALGMPRRTLISWLDAWGVARPRKRV